MGFGDGGEEFAGQFEKNKLTAVSKSDPASSIQYLASEALVFVIDTNLFIFSLSFAATADFFILNFVLATRTVQYRF